MRTKELELQILSILLDLVLLNLAIFGFYWLGWGFFFQYPLNLYLIVLMANFSMMFAYVFVPKRVIYNNRRFRLRFSRHTLRMIFFLVIHFLVYWPTSQFIAGKWLFIFEYSLAFYLVKLFAGMIYYKYVARRRHERQNSIRTLLVGRKKSILQVHRLIDANPMLQFKFVGFVAEDTELSNVLGHFNQFEKVVMDHSVEAVFAEQENEGDKLTDNISNDQLVTMCNRLGVRLYFVPKQGIVFQNDNSSMTLQNINIVNPQQIPLDAIENQIKKRVFDLVFSSLVIVAILSWLYPLIALLIKLESRGPVLFKQKRTGVNQREFMCYKFRSMAVNAKADEMQATKNDARITRIGKFLRKTNLDEFPQFFNVFKGDMSVVGPRPHMLKHTEEYKKLVEFYLVRHYVKPGITGWAQVSGYRGETDELWKMKKRVEYDMEYIEEWSFDWDVEIVWKTVFSRLAFFNAG